MAEWSSVVTLNGQDVSGRLVGRISIEAEESTSRVSSFTMLPLSGLIQAGDWIGATATIDYILDPNGSPVQTRLFTGNVNKSVFDPTSGFVSFECTDNLQSHFENMTEAQILSAIVDGRYAIEVFGEREDGWQQAVDVLSTVGKGYDLDRDGVTASLTDWEAKVTSDYSYNDSTIIDASVETDLIRLRDLVNTVNITAEYRFTRLHHRQHNFTWAAKIGLNSGFDFCDYFSDSYELPTRDMIQGAGAAGWAIKNEFIDFETLPVTGSYNCGGTVGWSISEELLNQLVVDAEWTVVRRWSQTITEVYSITIQEGGSIAQHGALVYEDGAGWQTDFDDSGWDASTVTEIPDGWVQNSIGDYSEDQVNRTNADNVILTLMQIGKTRICESHRQNFVSWETDLEPGIERNHTAEISSNTVTAKGKVFQYVHIMDIDAGSATTNVKIAVSSTWGGGGDVPLSIPQVPDSEPSHTSPSSGTSLDNRIGNDDTVPDFDENWTGFTGNFTVASGTPTPAQIYPRRFRVQTADIEDESRDEVQASSSSVYDIKCPDETLVLTVGLAPGETILISKGVSDEAFVGLAAQAIDAVGSSDGIAAFSGVGFAAVTIDASTSINGIATISGVGWDGTFESVGSFSGTSVVSAVSAAESESALSAVGSGVLSGFSIIPLENQILANNPISYHRFGESSGTTAASEVNTPTLDGTYIGSPTLGVTGAVSGSSDTAVTFNGTDQAMTVPSDIILDDIFDGGGSIELIFRPTDATVSTGDGIINRDDSTNGWGIQIDTPGGSSTGLRFFHRRSIDAGVWDTTSSTLLSYGTWHHIVIVYDSSSTSNTPTVYVDGSSVGLTVSTTPDGTPLSGDGIDITYGRHSLPDTFVAGSFDESATYDTELTSTEVSDRYDAITGTF